MAINFESKADVARETGLSQENIGTVRLQLERLLTEGILIELDIKGESMFAKTAEWGEIGIDLDDLRAARMNRGQKFLIDEIRIKNLRTVTTRMRQWLDKMTNDITGFRPWRYLYYKRYAEWKEKWEMLTIDFESAKQDLLDNYDADMAHLSSDFTSIAENSWKSIIACGQDFVSYDGDRFYGLAEFSERMVAHVLATVPTKEQIQATLKADYHVSILKGRSEIEAEAVKSADHKADLELIEARKKAEEQVIYADAVIKNEQMSQELEATRHLNLMNDLAEQEKRAAIEAMIKAEADHIRTQFAETVAPIEEVFSQVRNQMAEICLEAVESIKLNGHVRGRTAEKLKGLVDFYNMTSIQEDPQLLIKLQELRAKIGDSNKKKKKDAPDRSPEEVIAALKDVIDLQKTIKEDLDAGPSRFSFIS